MNAPRLVIVADDLTGAADSAARCVQAGLRASVLLQANEVVGDFPDALAVSTDSRFLPPEKAAAAVTSALSHLPIGPETVIYKKIDSTLRGNLGAELDAVAACFPDQMIVICPAFPAQQRGLEAGRLRYGSAPNPVHLPSLLAAQSQLKVGTVELEVVRAGCAVLAASLAAHRQQGNRLVVVDGMTDADLAALVTAAEDAGVLLCGSAGLVAPLAASLSGRPGVMPAPAPASGPILMIVGSGSPTAHTQVAAVHAAGEIRVRQLDRFWYDLDLVGAQTHPVGDWLIHLAPPEPGTVLEGAAARAQAAQLADLALAAVERLQPSVVLLVGGDTATFVLRRLGVNRLDVAAELLPGIPLTWGRDRQGNVRSYVLKPGNFGDAETLVTLHHALHARQRVAAA